MDTLLVQDTWKTVFLRLLRDITICVKIALTLAKYILDCSSAISWCLVPGVFISGSVGVRLNINSDLLDLP